MLHHLPFQLLAARPSVVQYERGSGRGDLQVQPVLHARQQEGDEGLQQVLVRGRVGIDSLKWIGRRREERFSD